MTPMRILAINPGSTSTKIAVFEDKVKISSANISHAAEELAKYNEVSDQLLFRKEQITKFLEENGLAQAGFSAVVGRGGGLMAVTGGVYTINDTLYDHAKRGANGVRHPAQLGPQLAREFAKQFQCESFVVNPPDTDELIPVARMTGIKGIYRNVHLHALNQKETAIQHATSLGHQYEDSNFIVCHIGGGISIAAHEKGRMIDGNDIVGGDGPIAPTRCGAIPAVELIDYCFSGVTKSQAKAMCTKSGGFVDLLGTSDAIEVCQRADNGDTFAELVWESMIYQIVKQIGAMAAALHGRVDGILLGGGMVHNQDLVRSIADACSFIAPIYVYPGEFEMEAMAYGAIRVLTGKETAKEYTGIPLWDKKDFGE